MKKKRLYKVFALLAAMVLSLSLLTGCAGKSTEAVQAQEDAETIQVYLWTNNLYEKYAPYVQSQLPDVNIEFIVGNNDLDFYKFLLPPTRQVPSTTPTSTASKMRTAA